VHADGGVGRARAAGDEADAGLAGQLAIGFRHIGRAAFLPADDQVDRIAGIVKGVKRSEIALAGYAEDAVGPVDAQRIHQNLASGTGIGFARHCMHFLNLTMSGSPFRLALQGRFFRLFSKRSSRNSGQFMCLGERELMVRRTQMADRCTGPWSRGRVLPSAVCFSSQSSTLI